MVQPPELPRRNGAEDFWRACHEIWLRPLARLTAWWNALLVPASCHHMLHAPVVTGRRLAVHEPIAHDLEQNLFARAP